MPIQRGDFVRPNNNRTLPPGSVWRVICSAGALKLEPENTAAKRVERSATGFRFPAQDAVKRGRHKPGYARKLTMEQATAIRASASPYALGREYGVTKSSVRYILAGKTYK